MGKVCMNQACNATATSPDWKRGWALNTGGFATLCSSCGSAYEDSVYCDTFHQEESGWRECRLCGMRIHCGCIVSKDLHTYLDSGGVGCIGCSKKLEKVLLRPNKVPNGDIPNGIVPLTANNVIDLQSSMINNRTDGVKVDKGMLIQLNKVISANEKLIQLSKAENKNDGPTEQIKQEGTTLAGEVGAATGFADLLQQCVGPSLFAKQDCTRQGLEVKRSVSAAYSALSFSLATPFHTKNTLEEKELSKGPPFQQGLRTGQNLPKLSKTGLDANKGTASETRVPRPPAEGRGRGQLLPRYWPRITDQELQQISGDLNSTVVPLFEKVLSASDAGRIGRLVLPKACAEAYFPPISQSEGLPIRVQDIKGKEWKFQFRFWPNNNSRMYVLEGVTPCIQNMQLEAGDTVTFSRIDPGGKLVMGFRKSSSTGDMQDCQPSALCNNTGSGKVSLPVVNDNQLMNDGGGTNGAMPHQQNLIPKKKKTRNIGFKSKRLHMHSEDAMELRLTWDEAQELLRPPPCARPNIVMIEDHVFEEYEEPPVFGKRTIFTSGASGNQVQWVQCDSCFKWRRLPVDFLVPPKWTCSENIWDSSRCSCLASGEMNPAELKSFLRLDRDIKKRRVVESANIGPEHEASGLDALATAAVLGENTEGPGEPSTAPTTRHPRHRPGCTCIVCIQPPSGKGRHKPACICNVCLTVKRRFKTLMLRKKKRQLERKVELALEKEKAKPFPLTNDSETNGTTGKGLPLKTSLEDERSQSKISELDLNCDPNREEDTPEAGTGMVICRGGNSMTRPSTSKCHDLEEKCILSTVGKQENREDENKDEEG